MRLPTDDKAHSRDLSSQCSIIGPVPEAGSGEQETSGECLTHQDEEIMFRLHLKEKVDVAT